MFWRRRPAATVDSAAPPFALSRHDVGTFDLLALRGFARAVLVFYPEDDTPICAEALRQFQGAVTEFNARQTRLAGLNHNDLAPHRRFAGRLALDFPLLVDPGGRVTRMYGAKRRIALFRLRVVVVDGRGVVRLIHDGFPDVPGLLTFLDGLTGDLPERDASFGAKIQA